MNVRVKWMIDEFEELIRDALIVFVPLTIIVAIVDDPMRAMGVPIGASLGLLIVIVVKVSLHVYRMKRSE